MRRIRRQVIPGFGPEQMVAARMHLRLTQDELADRAGIARRSYAGWERGDSTPTAAKLAPLIEFLESQGIDPRSMAGRHAEAGILLDTGLSDAQKAKLLDQLRQERAGS